MKTKSPLQRIVTEGFNVWSHMGLNHGPLDYESSALTS